MKIVFPKNIQPKDKNKALEIFTQYLNKEIHARKMGHGRFSVLNVGMKFRIVIRETKAEVLSHEAYNNLQYRAL